MFNYQYPHPAVTADTVVFGLEYDRTGKERRFRPVLSVLLILRNNEPFKNCWALPGGFVNMQESVEDGAARELQEETGIAPTPLIAVGLYSDPHRDPRERVITMAYTTVVRPSLVKVQAGDDADEARWFTSGELPALAFDHAAIIQDALAKIRERVTTTDLVFRLLEKSFTITQVRGALEMILGITIDPSNFNKKMRALATEGFIKIAHTIPEHEAIAGQVPTWYTMSHSAKKTETKLPLRMVDLL